MKKRRIQIASEIIARIKTEMQEPRLTDSVHSGVPTQTGPSTEEPAAQFEIA